MVLSSGAPAAICSRSAKSACVSMRATARHWSVGGGCVVPVPVFCMREFMRRCFAKGIGLVLLLESQLLMQDSVTPHWSASHSRDFPASLSHFLISSFVVMGGLYQMQEHFQVKIQLFVRKITKNCKNS